MAQVKSKIKGEYTYPSEYSEVPDGALKECKNCNIDRDSVAEPRRGFNTYRAISASGTDRTKQLLQFRDTLFAHYGTAISKDAADPFTVMSGTFSAPSHGDSYTPRLRSAEANSNFYFTSSNGLQKLSAIAGTIAKSGIPRGLDTNLTLTGASGFMDNDSQVAYRVLWGLKDANENVVLGTPSARVVISNSAGAGRDVIINFSIPSEVTTSYFFQIYRTGLTDTAAIEPNDECQLVYEANPTSAEITAKQISVTDSTPDDLRGASLYTDASQEGIAQSNDTPPTGKDIAVFKNCLFVANTKQKQSNTITLLSAYGASGVNIRVFTGDTTNASPTVLNASSTTGLAIGQAITGTGIAANTTILNIVGTTITLSINATATNVGTSLTAYDVLTIAGTTYLAAAAEDIATRKFQVFTAGTPSQNIANTAQSLVKVINRNTTNTTVYAYYASNLNELPGKIFIEARDLSTSAFTCLASSHGSAWSPSLPTSGTTVQSTAEEVKNRLHVSKVQRPEAFPRAQYYPVGSADKAFLRIIPLKESLIILKEDGAWRLTGNTPVDFNIDPLDLSVELLAPETAKVLNNQVYCVSNQGVSTISDTGVGVISRPIEDQISPKLAWANLPTTAFAEAYETERKYILWVPTATTDTYAMQAHIFNTFTGAWSYWDKPAACAIVNKADNKLYVGSPTTNKILQERKDIDYTDFADEDLAITVSSVAAEVLTLVSVTGIAVGDVVVQSTLPYATVMEIDVGANTITVDQDRNFTAAAATIKKAFECVVAWTSQYCGNPGIMKHIREVAPLFKEAEFRRAQLTFSTDLVFSEASVDITGFESFLWDYFAWGEIPWGDHEDLFKDRVLLPSEQQRCSWVNAKFVHSEAYGKFAIAGLEYTFEPMTEKSQT